MGNRAVIYNHKVKNELNIDIIKTWLKDNKYSTVLHHIIDFERVQVGNLTDHHGYTDIEAIEKVLNIPMVEKIKRFDSILSNNDEYESIMFDSDEFLIEHGLSITSQLKSEEYETFKENMSYIDKYGLK